MTKATVKGIDMDINNKAITIAFLESTLTCQFYEPSLNGMNVAQKLTSIKETDPSESINHVDADPRRRNVFTLSDRKDQSKLPRSFSTSCRKMAMDTIIQE